MDALIITLREGIEAALVLGIILAYLAKTNRDSLKKFAYAGLISAVIFSVLAAVIFKVSGVDPENELVEGIVLLTAAFFVGTMVVWMYMTGRFLKQKMEERIESIASSKTTLLQGIGIFLFAFLMVGREGIETVLMMLALTYQSASLIFTYSGAILGLALAVGFGYLFIKGSVKINLHKFFNYTSLILLLLTLKLLAGGIHEFTEIGLLPTPRFIMVIIGFLVRDNVSIAILIGFLAIPVVMIMLESRQKISQKLPKDAVEKRKVLAGIQRDRNYKMAGLSVALVAIFILGSALASASQVQDPAPQPLDAGNLGVELKKSQIGEGLSKFSINEGGKKIAQILVLNRNGAFSVALDACQVCGRYGYFLEEDTLICKNCNAPIPLESVGEKGGCNPLPFEYGEDSGSINISSVQLGEAAKAF